LPNSLRLFIMNKDALRLHVYGDLSLVRLPYIGCSCIHSRCRKYQVSVGYLSEPLFSLTTTQLLLYSVKPCEFTKGRPSHQVFDNWHQETCGLPMTSLVYWLEVLDTFRCQRPKNFCSLLVLVKVTMEMRKMCFGRSFVSFENKMLHTSL